MLEILGRLKAEVDSKRIIQPNWQVETVINAANVNVNVQPIFEAIDEICKGLRPPQENIQVAVRCWFLRRRWAFASFSPI